MRTVPLLCGSYATSNYSFSADSIVDALNFKEYGHIHCHVALQKERIIGLVFGKVSGACTPFSNKDLHLSYLGVGSNVAPGVECGLLQSAARYAVSQGRSMLSANPMNNAVHAWDRNFERLKFKIHKTYHYNLALHAPI